MTAAVMLALGSAATFGAADFLGGLASRRADAVPVALLSQAIGFVLVLVAMPLVPGAFGLPALGWGMLAGLGGAGGLILYFRALGMGAMGITAPIASLVGAAVPVTVGLGLGERPALTAAFGIAVGVVATVLVSRRAGGQVDIAVAGQRRALFTAAAAGLLFGVFFVGLDQAPDQSGLWPLVGARLAGLALLVGCMAVQRPGLPDGRVVTLAAVSGTLDMTANVLFLLATREGLLVLTSVVTGLYPVGVVVLAWLVLRERLSGVQIAGVGMALAATALIAV
ncbi:MAG TPA: DMT family transporter [Euzebya sp.]|nr:DMT family transporter [Euzebya sp.]